MLEGSGLVLTWCSNATSGGTELIFFAQLIAELGVQHSPLQSQ